MKNVLTVLREQVGNFYLMIRLALFEVKNANANQFLGRAWELLNPLLQLLVYWVVFGNIIRRGDPAEGVPFIYWLMSGMVVWFFIHASIMSSMRSIHQRIGMLSKMNFPFSAIPMISIFEKLYSHVLILTLVAVITRISGKGVGIQFIQVFYYMFATIMFLYALALVTSSLAALVRDTVMIVQAILRMVLYITPLLWPESDSMGFIYRAIIEVNPLTYVVRGYRASILGGQWFWEVGMQTWYFWGLTLVLFIIGSSIHMKFRRHFIDYL